MDILNIVADVLVFLVLLIPVILGIKRGFVDTALRFGKTIIAFILSCIFAKKLGAWLKEKIYPFVYEKISAFFEGETAETLSEGSMLEKLPEGVRNTLTATGFDVNQMASDAAEKGEAMVESFAQSVSNSAAGALAYVLAFVAVFVASLLLIAILRPLLNLIIEHLPVVKTFNRLLGALMGVFIGLLFAWIASQLLVGLLGLIAHNNWTDTYLLSFFYRFNPLQWLFSIAVQSIAAIAAVG